MPGWPEKRNYIGSHAKRIDAPSQTRAGTPLTWLTVFVEWIVIFISFLRLA